MTIVLVLRNVVVFDWILG